MTEVTQGIYESMCPPSHFRVLWEIHHQLSRLLVYPNIGVRPVFFAACAKLLSGGELLHLKNFSNRSRVGQDAGIVLAL